MENETKEAWKEATTNVFIPFLGIAGIFILLGLAADMSKNSVYWLASGILIGFSYDWLANKWRKKRGLNRW